MKRKLLLLVNEPGFFLSHRVNIAKKALAEGYDVVVATPPEALSKEIIAQGFRYQPVAFDKWSTNPIKDLIALKNIYALYKKEQPDIVHHVSIKPVIYGSIAARLAKVPAVVNAVSGLGYIFVSRGLKAKLRKLVVVALYHLAFRHPNFKIIFQNPDDVELFSRLKICPKERIAMVKGSGVDTNHFSPTEETPGKISVVVTSRLLSEKGIREFVDAARVLNKENCNASFSVVGDIPIGNPQAIPEAELAEWKREGNVAFLGYHRDVADIVKNAHIICLPSYREGLPKALIEGASAGKALVATDVPGCREIVKNGENGILVPPRDSKALADALRKLILDKDLRVAYGRRSRQMVMEEGFSEESVLKKVFEIYASLLDDN